jgi:hypothetical protein
VGGGGERARAKQLVGARIRRTLTASNAHHPRRSAAMQGRSRTCSRTPVREDGWVVICSDAREGVVLVPNGTCGAVREFASRSLRFVSIRLARHSRLALVAHLRRPWSRVFVVELRRRPPVVRHAGRATWSGVMTSTERHPGRRRMIGRRRRESGVRDDGGSIRKRTRKRAPPCVPRPGLKNGQKRSNMAKTAKHALCAASGRGSRPPPPLSTRHTLRESSTGGGHRPAAQRNRTARGRGRGGSRWFTYGRRSRECARGEGGGVRQSEEEEGRASQCVWPMSLRVPRRFVTHR